MTQSQTSHFSQNGDHRPGHYSNSDIYHSPGHTQKAQSTGSQTFIHSGKEHDLENDGIHLNFEMQDQISQAYHPGHEMATPLERVDSTHIRAVSGMTAHDQSEQI